MTYPRPKPKNTNSNWPAFYGSIAFHVLVGVIAIFVWPVSFRLPAYGRFIAGVGVSIIFTAVVILPIVGYLQLGRKRSKD